MASRQEEKDKRRQERLAREQAETSAAARRKRVQYAVGGLIALAVVAGLVVLVVVGLGGSGSKPGEARSASDVASSVKLPAQQTGDLATAAKAAGCKLANPAIKGNGQHATKEFKAADYNSNPPTSGVHNPQWYDDGIYAPGDVPRLGELVHTLEHGRIDVQYKPGTPKDTVAALEALLAEQSDGYHMLLFQNTTGMQAQVAATAWGHSLTCAQMNDKVYDAIRTFRARYIDKGPEVVQ